MVQLIEKLIGKRAEETIPEYLGQITVENYDIWEEHWFDTANVLIKEFYSQGLKKTGDAIEAIIKDQRKLLSYKRKG